MSNYYGQSRIDAMQDSYNAGSTWEDDIATMHQIIDDIDALTVGEYGSTMVRGIDGDALYTLTRGGGAHRR